MTTRWNERDARVSGFGNRTDTAETLRISQLRPGQSYPEHYPHPSEPLGTPLTIRQVAQLIGCSAWTVRQRYLPQGLPHLRSGPAGKLIFFRDQVIRWILHQQQKGGNSK